MASSTTIPKAIFAPANSNSNSQADQYTLTTLSLTDLSPNPLTQFHEWFAAAGQRSHVHQPETTTLSTAHLPSGRVSARMVYLKELDARGFVVYSNWATSRKARDIQTNPYAALTFWWREVERQVRVEGRVERLTPEASQVYFDTRIRGSRIGAWASRQSEVLEGESEVLEGESDDGGHEVDGNRDDGRKVLDGRVQEVERRFDGVEKIPVPDFWGGLRVVPDMVEFWQGRPSRLHDRFRYTRLEMNGERDGNGASTEWKIERLSP